MQNNQTTGKIVAPAVSPGTIAVAASGFSITVAAVTLFGLTHMSGLFETSVMAAALIIILMGVLFSGVKLNRLGRSAS